tara:strand:- start:12057 stop:13049 length:993 start_codon:yes stop_codon:yes gene_type:complete
MINNKTILITGGTGSFGTFFSEYILKNYNPKKLIIYSRDELKQFHMKERMKKNKKKLRFFIGDIRDPERLNFALNDVDIVIHAAALKQVDTCEYNPFEAIKTNVLGAQNVIDQCRKNNVSKILALSTDKAASPINLYGATKLTSDKLFVLANDYVGKKNIKFSVVRYGNVMGSRGSVIPKFLSKRKSEAFEITSENMTRFNITLEQSVNFVLDCLSKLKGGEIFIPKLPSYQIIDLVRAINPKPKIKIIGIRPGEKIYEEMIPETDSLNAIEFKNYYIIFQNDIIKNNYIKATSEKFKKIKKPFSYNSKNNTHFLKVKELKNLIKKNVAS